MPLYEHGALWLAQQEVSLDIKLHHIERQVAAPLPQVRHEPLPLPKEPAYTIMEEPPTTALPICYFIYYHRARSARIQTACSAFVNAHHIRCWQQITAQVAADFHAHVSTLHTLTPPQGHWQPQHNLMSTLCDIFSLDHFVDGETWPTHFLNLIHPLNPQSTMWTDYMGTPGPIQFLWCIQKRCATTATTVVLCQMWPAYRLHLAMPR